MSYLLSAIGCAGVALVVAGIAMVSPPSAVIVAGLLLCGAGGAGAYLYGSDD